MKKTVRVIAAVLCVLLLAVPFAACKQGPAVKKVKTNVTIYSDTECKELFMLIENLELDEGSTVLQAVESLCEKRSASYSLDSTGQFMTFTFEGDTIQAPEGETLDNGNVRTYFFGWKYNGELMTSIADKAVVTKPADKTVEDGSSIVIFMQVEEVTPASN
jgi:hypothetical protein